MWVQPVSLLGRWINVIGTVSHNKCWFVQVCHIMLPIHYKDRSNGFDCDFLIRYGFCPPGPLIDHSAYVFVLVFLFQRTHIVKAYMLQLSCGWKLLHVSFHIMPTNLWFLTPCTHFCSVADFLYCVWPEIFGNYHFCNCSLLECIR